MLLAIGGFDAAGRVGLLADQSAAQLLHARYCLVPTAMTAQGPSVFLVDPVAPKVLLAQLEAVLEAHSVSAVKIGMVPNAALLRAIARRVLPLGVPVVVDPVVQSSRGQRLSNLQPADYRKLAGPGVFLTPNLDEASWLLGRKVGPSRARAIEVAEVLVRQGFEAVVLKGIRPASNQVGDVVATAEGAELLSGPKLRRGADRRGTGCRFGSALAVKLGQGAPFARAARAAQALVRRYIRSG